MASFESTAWPDLVTLMQTTWPEIGDRVYRTPQLADASFVKRVALGEITPPFALVNWGASIPTDWGLDNEVYSLELSVAYLVSVADPRAIQPDGSVDTGLLTINQLIALRESLVSYSGSFQLAGTWPKIDLAIQNSLIRPLFQQEIGIIGGIVQFEILFGQYYD